MDMDVDMDAPYSDFNGSGRVEYPLDRLDNYTKPPITLCQGTLQYPSQNAHGANYAASNFGYSTPTPPAKPRATTRVTVVVDTNVLLDYLMVIQKFVADIEKMGWPSVVIIPSVVISELDWQKTTRNNISWSARAASRWILDKLKEEKEKKAVRVQADHETLKGLDSKNLQPDKNTENDISIGDCCRYFRRKALDPVFLLTGDINLSIRIESIDVQALEPRKDWSSHVIASSIFGSDVCREFDKYVQSQMRQGPSSTHIQSSTGGFVVDRMDVDLQESVEWIPSHILDDLHLQLVDHFTILLRELVERVNPGVVRSAGKDGVSSSMHAGALVRPFKDWTAADCLGFLGTLRKTSRSGAVRLESFMSKPHCKDANARGRRRGQDWTRVQWDTALQELEGVGKDFEDHAIEESVDLLKIAVDDYFRLPT